MMMTLQTQTKISVIIIWTSFILSTRAWGPISHVYLCSLAAEKSGNETSTSAVHSFFSGCNSPDSLKQVWPELHSLEFAAHLFGYAVQHHNQSATNSKTDLINFALGFGCHVANDEVGHHTNGFLTPPSNDHEIEFNLDSMIFHERKEKHFDAAIVNGEISDDAIDLILNAAISYHNMFDGHTSAASTALAHRYIRAETSTSKPDRARIQSAIKRFQVFTSAEHALIRIQPPYLYEFELKRNSFCNVSSYEEVVNNFNLSADWALSTCHNWRSIMMWTTIKPDDTSEKVRVDAAAQKMHNRVDGMFSANDGTSCVH